MCLGIRFNSTDGSMYFGRNYDWNTSYGERPTATPAGFPVAWRHMEPTESRHAVIGMAIDAGGYPLYYDAANDAGLAIAGLSFPTYCRYAEEPVEGRTNVTTFEFPLWITSTFENLAQVEEALSTTVIMATPFSEEMPTSPLHWIIGDATGSIVVECTERGMEVFHDEFDVITNEPGFAWHRANVENYTLTTEGRPSSVEWGGEEEQAFRYGLGLRGFPGDYSPASRFVKAAYLNTHYPAEESENDNVVRMFRTLESVAVPKGAVLLKDDRWNTTLYRSAWSAKTRTYYVERYDELSVSSYRLDDVDFDGEARIVQL